MPRARSNLFRRKRSPFWQASWTDADGVPHEGSTGCRDHGAASLWLAGKEREAAAAALGLPVAKQVALKVALAEYLVESDFADKWNTTVEGMFRHDVLPFFGRDTIVSSIDEPSVLRFRNVQKGRPDRRFKAEPPEVVVVPQPGVCIAPGCGARFDARKTGGRPQTCCSEDCAQRVRNLRAAGGPQERHKEPKPVSHATVNRLFWEMQAFGKWCIRRHYALVNPWKAVETLPEDELPIPDIDNATWAKFLLAIPIEPVGRKRSYRLREVLEFAREVGMRKGELGRLAWTDFSLTDRVGYIVSSHQRGRTKTRKGRPFALSVRAAEILAGVEKRGRRTDGLVFGPLGDHRHALAKAAEAAGLPRAWLHLMRHLGASAFARSGAGNNDLQAFGGWSSLKMAERYTKVRALRLRELLDRASSAGTTQALPSEKESADSP